LGNFAQSVHCYGVSSNGQADELPSRMAEEILRILYGDDFAGCTVHPDRIAEVINAGLKPVRLHSEQVLELYEKVVEAIHLLSTPPDATKITDPDQVRILITERLDTIHTVTSKTIETTARAKAQLQSPPSTET
jgi:hypothetical protein